MNQETRDFLEAHKGKIVLKFVEALFEYKIFINVNNELVDTKKILMGGENLYKIHEYLDRTYE